MFTLILIKRAHRNNKLTCNLLFDTIYNTVTNINYKNTILTSDW